MQLAAKGEEDKVAAGLAALHEEDPAFVYRVDPELHQTIMSAQGELHLEVLVDRLRRRFNAHVELGEPRIPFRETIKATADSRYRHKKQTGGAGQFAEVWMRIEPLPRDSGVEFTESLSGQNVDRVFVPSVEEGVQNACREGILAGFKVVDVKIDFYDGKMHPVDSKDIAFQIAGYFAFKEAFMNARPCLLEPIHQIEVRIPEDCLGKVMGDVSSRRGRILGIDTDGPFQVIRAEVPAARSLPLFQPATFVDGGTRRAYGKIRSLHRNATRTGAKNRGRIPASAKPRVTVNNAWSNLKDRDFRAAIEPDGRDQPADAGIDVERPSRDAEHSHLIFPHPIRKHERAIKRDSHLAAMRMPGQSQVERMLHFFRHQWVMQQHDVFAVRFGRQRTAEFAP